MLYFKEDCNKLYMIVRKQLSQAVQQRGFIPKDAGFLGFQTKLTSGGIGIHYLAWVSLPQHVQQHRSQFLHFNPQIKFYVLFSCIQICEKNY